jgi:hypothetical protein
MPVPKWKKKTVYVWHKHASIIIAVWLSAISAVMLAVALEWMFSQ